MTAFRIPPSPHPVPSAARRRLLCLLGSAALASGVRAAAAGPQPLDLMPAFWSAWDDGLHAPAAERAHRLWAGFFAPHAADYRRAGTAVDEAAVAAWLPRFDGLAAATRRVHARFVRDYASRLATFRRALPDFDPAVSPVTLLPSLFRFDGHLEAGGKVLPLYFGPDGIVRWHGADADLDVLFSHELFHCYHAQRNPALMLDPKAPVFGNLWLEGLATYASEQLNPGAGLLHVLLDDEALAQADRATLRRVAQALLDHADDTDAATLASFFGMGAQAAWPARAGYYVGLLLARRIGASMPLPRMAALPTPQVRTLLLDGLREMAASGAQGMA
jgi:hypothetical protein